MPKSAPGWVKAVKARIAIKERVGLIQGQIAMSLNEWYLSQAFDQLQIPYYYQVPLAGGRAYRGGIVLDFLVDYKGRRIAVPVRGGYYHRDKAADDLMADAICKRKGYIVQEILVDETNTRADALAAAKKYIL